MAEGASTAVAVAEPTRAVAPRKATEIRVVADPIAVLDTARFEHMQRIATVMAHSNLIPDSLCFEKQGDEKVALPIEVVTANCFLVVNQAVRWQMDPFAVAQCVSVVHGRLCYEGKLIAAVIEGKLGVELEYDISGQNEAMKVVVTGTFNGKPILDSKGKPKTVEGTVAEWRTNGRGSPWDAKGGFPRMLRYRGAREWGRVHRPGLMLGVYSDDEMEDLNTRFQARTVDDGGGPPVPAHDDGGGPPVPNEEGTSTEVVGKVVDDGGGPPVPAAEEDTFPGDKPMPSSRHAIPEDGSIPVFLRDQDQPKEVFSERHWLASLDAAFAKCTDLTGLAEAQSDLMTPHEGKVSTESWNMACDYLDSHVERINSSETWDE